MSLENGFGYFLSVSRILSAIQFSAVWYLSSLISFLTRCHYFEMRLFFLINHVIIAFLFLSFVDTFEGISFKCCFYPGFPTASRITANLSQPI